ncbi:unnamed protein product [Oikopleura dioica]|uniref:AAA+ ATPase domain-containing protein n=1 Tax=Oikopleura dioica TaxID=34765 RepID=E4Y553_OIKDI|nr:unnamed protein product [Oikopleura dioica]
MDFETSQEENGKENRFNLTGEKRSQNSSSGSNGGSQKRGHLGEMLEETSMSFTPKVARQSRRGEHLSSHVSANRLENLRVVESTIAGMALPKEDDDEEEETNSQENLDRRTKEDKQYLENIRQETLPESSFDDIVGQEEAKVALIQSVILPIKQPQLFEGLKQWRRILLYGPPGTGKTSLVKCTAQAANAPFYSVTCSTLLSPYLGESEKRVREIFSDARANSTKNRPAIIFIDEVDSVTRTRTAHEDESTRRLKSELLLQLEGDFSEKSVEPFIIACSNCPWDLDPAFVRRFSRRILVDLPSSDDCAQILKKKMDKAGVQFSEKHWNSISDKFYLYSGSDIDNVATATLMRRIDEVILCENWDIHSDGRVTPSSPYSRMVGTQSFNSKWANIPNGSIIPRNVKIDDLQYALTVIKPSISETAYQKFTQYEK